MHCVMAFYMLMNMLIEPLLKAHRELFEGLSKNKHVSVETPKSSKN